jgi:hypothetical protein
MTIETRPETSFARDRNTTSVLAGHPRILMRLDLR